MKDKVIGLITANYSTTSQSALTENRPVANLPFLGRYRLIDFPLSNMVNCGIRTVGIVMPFNYRSIIDHVSSGKDWGLDRKDGGLFLLPGSAFGTARTGSRFLLRDFLNNKAYITRSGSDYIVMCSCNFLYEIDFDSLIAAHKESGADITVVTADATVTDPDVLGLTLEDGRVVATHQGISYGDTAFLDCFIISREFLTHALEWYAAVDYLDIFEALKDDYNRVDVETYHVSGYSAPIFNVDAYFRANMDMLKPDIAEALFPDDRIVRTKAHDSAPAKYEHGSHVANSRVSAGCRIYGSVVDSIIGRNVVVEPGATIRNSIIMQNCTIKSGARVEYAIVDRNNVVAPGIELRGTPEDLLVEAKPKE